MHSLEGIAALNAREGQSKNVDLSAYKPWGLEFNTDDTNNMGYRARNTETNETSETFPTYARAVADVIQRHAA